MNCERCNAASAVKKEKYCVKCRKIVLKEMYESGQLQRVGIGDAHVGQRRGQEARENTYETKYGTGH
jgi:hypothetical protein